MTSVFVLTANVRRVNVPQTATRIVVDQQDVVRQNVEVSFLPSNPELICIFTRKPFTA